MTKERAERLRYGDAICCGPLTLHVFRVAFDGVRCTQGDPDSAPLGLPCILLGWADMQEWHPLDEMARAS